MEITEIFERCTLGDRHIKLPDIDLDRDTFLEVKKTLQNAGGKWVGGKVQHFAFDFSPSQLLDRLADGEKPNFKQDNQFFETTKEIIGTMLIVAGIGGFDKYDPNETFLEPSAGRFAIGKELHDIRPRATIDCYESNEYNQQFIRDIPYTNLLGGDFLKAEPVPKYDWIFANPPFSRMQDASHVMHMAKFLKPYGTIVAVMSCSWQKDRVVGFYKTFQGLLKAREHRIYDLEKNAFKESGTLVDTCIVVIHGEAVPSESGCMNLRPKTSLDRLTSLYKH